MDGLDWPARLAAHEREVIGSDPIIDLTHALECNGIGVQFYRCVSWALEGIERAGRDDLVDRLLGVLDGDERPDAIVAEVLQELEG